MRAIGVKQPGGAAELVVVEAAVPSIREDEVLIRVAGAGLNRADVHQREGRYPPPAGASETLGLEVSGVVAALGAAVTRWRTGDRVCGLLAGGGYAEYAAVAATQCLPVPDEMRLVDAAALPEATFTVWANLFHQPLVNAGETLLVQGGTSGIGTFAIQAGRYMGVRVAATAGTAVKLQTCRELGAEAASSYKGDWAAEVKSWTGGCGVDVILDMIGGDYFGKHIELLAERGLLTHIAFAQGAIVEMDLRRVMAKRLVITGSMLRARPAAEKAELRDALEKRLWPGVLGGEIRPVIDRIFPLDEVAAAHRYFDSGQHVGKILLSFA